MPNKKISELTAAGALTGAELVEAVQGGQNVKTTAQDIANLGVAGGGGSWGTIIGTLSNQTDLQAALDAKTSDLNAHINDATAAHAASAIAFTPEGQIGSTTVQAAIAELDEEVDDRILAALAGLKWKDAVRVATTTPGTLATSFENGDTVDGVVIATGNRILLKDQADQTTNGIYTVNASGAPTRATDADSNTELEGAAVSVLEGTTNPNTTWLQITDSISIGVSNIVWTQYGSSVPDADETTKGIAERATDAEVITGTDTTRFASPASIHAKVVGIQDLFIPASAMWPRNTAGCADIARFEMATSLVNVQALAFDGTTQEFAQIQITLPRKWNNGTITVAPYWTATSGSGTVQWGISGGAYSNDDALTVALGSAQTSDDTLLAANDLHIGPATSAITLAGTPADSDFLAIQVSRNPASDTLATDALLLGISIRITTDAAKDA